LDPERARKEFIRIATLPNAVDEFMAPFIESIAFTNPDLFILILRELSGGEPSPEHEALVWKMAKTYLVAVHLKVPELMPEPRVIEAISALPRARHSTDNFGFCGLVVTLK
jgi:hypothetical protein